MNTDDTLDTSEKARADVLMALIMANKLPPFKHVSVESAEDLPRMHAEVESYGEDTLFVFMIPKEVSMLGAEAGACATLVLRDLPKNVHGRIIISFDGYNDDPRELHEVPEVVDFCLGILLGPNPAVGADPENFAQVILPLLLDERKLHSTGFMDAFDMSGCLWVVSTAFARDCYVRNRRVPSGWARNMTTAINLLQALLRAR